MDKYGIRDAIVELKDKIKEKEVDYYDRKCSVSYAKLTLLDQIDRYNDKRFTQEGEDINRHKEQVLRDILDLIKQL